MPRAWYGAAFCLLQISALAAVGAQQTVGGTAAADSTTSRSTPRDSVKRDSVKRDSLPALATLLATASRLNALPAGLLGYRAAVETEISSVLHRADGTEVVAAVEQVASTLRWERSGLLEQHVVGYRTVGTSMSLLARGSDTTGGWLTPTLYGNRFVLRSAQRDTASRTTAARTTAARRRSQRDGSDTLPVVHPLATDRNTYYEYSGGDTIVTLRLRDREVPIVHVHVHPRATITERVLLFDGEMDLDASRGTLVRMRGRFVFLNTGTPKTVSAVLRTLANPVAFIDYENAERDERYWLPAQQRIELQVSAPILGEATAVVRIVSRFRDVVVHDTSALIAALPIGRRVRRLSYAPDDSINRFDAWTGRAGDVTGSMSTIDFASVGPDRMRLTGAPRFDVSATRVSDVVHFNRVEGVYTGLGVKLSLRDAAPGVVVRTNAGYAWSEHTWRGRASVAHTSERWSQELRAGRSLDITNDFRAPLDSGTSIFSLIFGNDPYDYVDRRSAAVGLIRHDAARTWLARIDAGPGDDRYRPVTSTRTPPDGDAYRPNRGVDEGSYMKGAMLFDWHPSLTANVLRQGVSARLAYEQAGGTLAWQRTEARATARRWVGPILLATRADLGLVTGARIPSQQLFELGEREGLPGYDEKEFAGSRAAVLRAQAMYQSRYYQRPIRLFRTTFLPAPAPGFSVGVQGGVADAPSVAARASILRLGLLADSTGTLVPVSRVTTNVRTTVSAGLRFFSGATFLGFARPIDQPAKWRFVWSSGAQW